MTWKYSKEAFVREVAYLELMAKAQSSIGPALADCMSGMVSWGPWGGARSAIQSTFDDIKTKMDTADTGLNEVAVLVRSTADSVIATEEANKVR